MNWLEKVFKLRENNTTVKREIYGGIISFLAVSYILAVNPAILKDAGMDQHGVFFVTALSGFFGTALMAVLANYPLLLAPGIGVISWTILNCRIKGRVNWLLWLVSLIFAAKYIFL